jgi:hypothetical protein
MVYNAMSIYPNSLTSDIAVRNGKLIRCTLSDTILENVKQRLLTIYQEWFLHLDEGLPWFTDFAGKNVNVERIRTKVGRTIATTEGVEQVISIDIQYDVKQRRILIQFKYTDRYGQIINEVF